MKKIIGLFFTLFLLFPQMVVNASEKGQTDLGSTEANTAESRGMNYWVDIDYHTSNFLSGWKIEQLRVTDQYIEFDANVGSYTGGNGTLKTADALWAGPEGKYESQGKRISRGVNYGRHYYTIRFERNQYINGTATIRLMNYTYGAENYIFLKLNTGVPVHYGGLLVSIQSKIDPWKVIDWELTGNKAISYHNYGNSNQKWYLEYDEVIDAYSIYSYRSKDSYLVENSNGQVVVTDSFNKRENSYWKLISEGNHVNGNTYYLKNFQSGKVMDIEASKLDGGNIITFNKTGTENQKFILHIEGRK
ncbi:RICIN domain-containing protein [Enterococcus thailandicus]|uniref:RICIN domain-containing protein n=1 Tax=Enterococcus thailandicus TaxID=417368 RepID=UPI0022E1325C|nr:RICIN domain-containing protein [Enterococcus thailandicus]